jgi:hypothetical protein
MPLKVSAFDPADPLDGSELFGLAKNDENRKVTLDDITTFISDSIEADFADPIVQDWSFNWNDDANIYIAAKVAMTIDEGATEIGTGTITYQKSTAAAPTVFNDTTLPVILEQHAWLKVTATGVVDEKAIHLVRTA